MKVTEALGISGQPIMILRGPDGRIKAVRIGKNLVTDVGLAYLAGLLSGAETVIPAHVGVGTDQTAADHEDVGLKAEVGTRVNGTKSRATITVTNDTYVSTALFAAANGTGALKECGLFNAATNGTLVARWTFDVINKAAADTLEIAYRLKHVVGA
jgi:hypothetical protein